MAETNPSEIRNDPGSRSAGSEDHKVSPMRNQGEDQTENNPSQAQQETFAASTAETPLENHSWFIEIIEARESESQGSSKLPKVPEKLRNSKNEISYRPLAVSIGPYHNPYEGSKYGKKFKTEKEPLNDGEKLKADMARQFVNDIRKMKEEEAKKAKGSYDEDSVKGISYEYLCTEIEKVAREAKEFYDKDSVRSFSEADFTKMMFIDGCFIVHFIYYFTRKYDKLEMSDNKAALVKRDLLLLENQLPYEVLDTLRKLRFGEEETNMFDEFLETGKTEESSSIWVRLGYYFLIFIIIISCCCCCCCCCFFCSRGQPLPPSPPEKKKDPTRDETQPAHLLERLYKSKQPKETGEPKKNGEPKETGEPKDTGEPKETGGQKTKGKEKRHRGHYLYCSAKELKKVGIHFQRSGTNELTDVKFGSIIFPGTLELPPITIDKSTKSMLLNLVAYESSVVPREKHWVASYICFMDSLINDAEDVKELRSKGIINNYLGPDEEVAKIFNDMSSSLDPETSVYNDVKREINEQCESVFNKWVGQWVQDYFSSPWAFLALVGAVFTIFLTAVATYAAIWPIN